MNYHPPRNIVIDGKTYFSKELLKSRLFSNTYQQLLIKDKLEPESLKEEIIKNLDRLSLGIEIYNQNTDDPFSNNITTIEIDNIIYDVSEGERILVQEISSYFKLETKLCFQLFKCFLGSRYFKVEWDHLFFYSKINNNRKQSFSIATEFQSLMNAFTQFYFEERLLSYNILVEILKANLNEKDSFNSYAMLIYKQLLPDEASTKKLVRRLLKQINNNLWNIKMELINEIQLQTLLEYKVILEVVFLIIENSQHSKWFINLFRGWYIQSNRPFSTIQLFNKFKNEFNNIKTLELAILIQILQLNKLVHDDIVELSDPTFQSNELAELLKAFNNIPIKNLNSPMLMTISIFGNLHKTQFSDTNSELLKTNFWKNSIQL
ncbi:hypothetical protein K502DRAFT_344778 [Neoconidiobolus thromboides FSU 785]|nr:hypothetical protein K502DRAFT_344778 [Neoconidiobolus thromboides FSU 785]